MKNYQISDERMSMYDKLIQFLKLPGNIWIFFVVLFWVTVCTAFLSDAIPFPQRLKNGDFLLKSVLLLQILNTGIVLYIILPVGTMKTELTFGLSKPNGGFVSETDWQKFVNDYIDPLFEAMTLMDVRGRWKSLSEGSKVLILLHKNDVKTNQSIESIIKTYREHFDQDCVMRVTYRVGLSYD